jgi:multidrug efflux pump subunit AcrA (membrane-fusion protein)
MTLPRRRLLLFLGGGIAILIPLLLLLGTSGRGAERALSATVKRGEFRVVVTTTGELHARRFVQVQGPTNAQQAQQYQMRIASLVPEGTIVKAGEIVGQLDRSGIASKVQEVALALDKAEAQYQQAQLDSTLQLSQAREEIRNLEYALEERQIAKDQSAYEAPSMQRQAEIDLDKARRALDQARANYITKEQQARAKMREVGSDVERQRNLLAIVREVEAAYTIRAPSDGMVIYAKEWNGQKKVAGSQVSPWDPTVATLPDLSQMESVTYVNEIDIRKVAVGQSVEISLDADPSKRLTGTVTQVANVGEQRPNADAKVFEVRIEVQQSDTTILPGMTTGNSILTSTVRNALSIPLETVAIDDGVTFVYLRTGRGIVRQEIATGIMNDDNIVVLHGLEEGDEVLFTPPADGSSPPLERLPPELAPPPDTATIPAADTPPMPTPATPAADSLLTTSSAAPYARTGAPAFTALGG